jgi:hypothetical protein
MICSLKTLKFNDLVDKDEWNDDEAWVSKPNYKGFMVDNTQANWNIVRIVYGFEDPFVKMH